MLRRVISLSLHLSQAGFPSARFCVHFAVLHRTRVREMPKFEGKKKEIGNTQMGRWKLICDVANIELSDGLSLKRSYMAGSSCMWPGRLLDLFLVCAPPSKLIHSNHLIDVHFFPPFWQTFKRFTFEMDSRLLTYLVRLT